MSQIKHFCRHSNDYHINRFLLKYRVYMHAHINISVQRTDQQLYIQKLSNTLQINQFYESIVQFNYLLLSLFTYIKFMDYRNDKVLLYVI